MSCQVVLAEIGAIFSEPFFCCDQWIGFAFPFITRFSSHVSRYYTFSRNTHAALCTDLFRMHVQPRCHPLA